VGKALTREQILGAKDVTVKTVDVPEWGGPVNVRVMSGARRGYIESRVLKGDMQQGDMRIIVCASTICDDEGFAIFTNDDIELLGEKSSIALDRVFAAALELNGMQSGAVEEAKKN
jgi:hypothetical protein